MSSLAGSSPHTRGARELAPLAGGALGIIPAYAGSTRYSRRARSAYRDHPRIRGEHWGHGGPGRGPRGSSPHTRGAHLRRLLPEDSPGIIPAYAGSTRWSCLTRGRGRDHPRIRGEHSWTRALMPAIVGSSPHTRGAPGHSTRAACSQLDHPRIRGEHSRESALNVKSPGSSPHTRGARGCAHDCRGRAGIIPAYAGSTYIRRRASRA